MKGTSGDYSTDQAKEIVLQLDAKQEPEKAVVFKKSPLFSKVQKDKMVELLKRNHDVMMEKYETYRLRNEALEKKALEKENLYVVIKGENDNLAN